MRKTFLFQAIHFSINMPLVLLGPYQWYHSGLEWTWEWWQWRGTLHSPKLQHCLNLTIRLFSVISRPLVGGVFPLSREEVSVFYCSSRLGKWFDEKITKSKFLPIRGGGSQTMTFWSFLEAPPVQNLPTLEWPFIAPTVTVLVVKPFVVDLTAFQQVHWC